MPLWDQRPLTSRSVTTIFPSKFWNVLECLLSKRERVCFYVTFFRESCFQGSSPVGDLFLGCSEKAWGWFEGSTFSEETSSEGTFS